MTTSEHAGFSDELIEPTGAVGLWSKAGIPSAQIIALQIGEFLSVRSNNELRHIRMIKIAAHDFELLGRIMPPFTDVRRLQPAPNRRQVVG